MTLKILMLGAVLTLAAGAPAFAQMKDDKMMADHGSMKMSKSQMMAMHKCESMSKRMMMRNRKCVAMMKAHPDMKHSKM